MRLHRSLACLSVLFAGAACNYAKDGTNCRPRQVPAALSQPRFLTTNDGSSFPEQPSCSVDERGAVILSFIPPACNPLDSWWAGCAFRLHQDMRAFDAGKDGIFVAKLCVDNFPPAAVNLRYGPSKNSKFIKLFSGSPAHATSTCIVVNLGSTDACYSTDRCGPSCTEENPSTTDGPCKDLSDSDLVVMTEWCQADPQPVSKPVTVRLESLVHYPPGCQCQSDSECAAPWVCRNDGWAATSHCNGTKTGCPAICSVGVPSYP